HGASRVRLEGRLGWRPRARTRAGRGAGWEIGRLDYRRGGGFGLDPSQAAGRPGPCARMPPMCRALLYLGVPGVLDDLLYPPDSALVRQATMPKMLHMLNLAGFGMRAWDRRSREPAKPWAYASTELPVFDRNLKGLAEKVEAEAIIAHVRGVAYSTA